MEERIAELKKQLTGNLFQDLEIQQEIYDLKRIMAIERGEDLEDEEDTECLYCSG